MSNTLSQPYHSKNASSRPITDRKKKLTQYIGDDRKSVPRRQCYSVTSFVEPGAISIKITGKGFVPGINHAKEKPMSLTQYNKTLELLYLYITIIWHY